MCWRTPRRSWCTTCAGRDPAAIATRDSKNPAGPMLTLKPAVFSRFLAWTTAAE
ncbi:DUF397 domain-containing protein [Streptomyces sp. NBC_01485]|uniref:DUF397 domain-containing protein n=1 Tax=Streptomyces sp. NBC_01485 TaxID=2903884 RepID=UPI002E32CA30|nr:DUF397 domain-containing protein [Streptomyces sp. NBC_01485]